MHIFSWGIDIDLSITLIVGSCWNETLLIWTNPSFPWMGLKSIFDFHWRRQMQLFYRIFVNGILIVFSFIVTEPYDGGCLISVSGNRCFQFLFIIKLDKNCSRREANTTLYRFGSLFESGNSIWTHIWWFLFYIYKSQVLKMWAL